MIRPFALACVLVSGCGAGAAAQVRPAAVAVCSAARATCSFVNAACGALDTSGGSVGDVIAP